MKILFTSVGRRVELIECFRTAAKKLNIDLKIIGADIASDAPALCFCDKKEIVCKIHDDNYIPQLISICKENKVDCLIPTIDTDLLLLSKNKTKFEEIGTKVLISNEDKVALCRDKRFTSDYFCSIGLKAPVTIDSIELFEAKLQNGKIDFPVFIKPKDGSSSINAYRVDDIKTLSTYAKKIEDYIIQPFISGREYTVDIFCDYEGNPLYITPRERLAVRSGEVLKTKIVQDDSIISQMFTLVQDYKPCGQITVQLIQNEAGENYYIEINPRFGGGAPLSIKAGADSACAVLYMLMGKKQSYTPKAAKDGAIYSRFDQSVCVNKKNNSSIKAVIFDLDDTLYSEKEYLKSGFRAIEAQTGISADKFYKAFLDKKPAIDTVLYELGKMELKDKCLKIYREHNPNIFLYNGVYELLQMLAQNGIFVGIITDGRPNGQNAKIDSLGIRNMVDKIIITDELGGEMFRKPCDIAFRIMKQYANVEYENMLYVGDNPQKDFFAPNELGMQSIQVINDGSLYSFEKSLNNCVYGIKELKNFLKERM